MSSHDMSMDDVMKDTLLAHAFSNSAKIAKTLEGEMILVQDNWEQLFNSFLKCDIYASFINQCEQLKLDWRVYNFHRYNLFLDEWKEEIQEKLIKKIADWASDCDIAELFTKVWQC